MTVEAARDPGASVELARLSAAPLADAEGVAALVDWLAASASEVVALDTEADSLHAYPEKLCLIQLSARAIATAAQAEQVDALIDPLAGVELDPLLALLRARTLILHGADFDLRLLHRTHTFAPTRVFDTMLAARLLGEKRVSLQALLSSRLGVSIEKGPRKANWSRRPLRPRMIAYARNDTRHLEDLAAGLRAELEQRGRATWHEEMCARLVLECAQPRAVDPDQVWRLKGSARLAPRELAVLRALWRWREDEAVRANRPPYFVVAHEHLVAVAAASSDGERALPIPASLASRRRRGLLEAVERGLALSAEACPSRRKRAHTRPLNGAQQGRLAALKQRRDRAAAALELEPALIASKQALERLARDPEAGAAELMAWQRDLVLRDL